MAELRERGLAGMKFKVGGLTPEEDAARFRIARAAAGPDFVLCADANQGWSPARRRPLRTPRRRPRPVLVRGAVPLVERPPRHARRPLRRRRARLRRPERVLRGRLPRPDGRGRDRLLQLRLLLVGRGDRVAPRRGRGVSFDVAMAHHEEPQIASPPARVDPARDVPRGFSAERDPIWWNLVANRPPIVDGRMTLPDAARASAGSSTRDYIEAYRVSARRVTRPARGPALGEGLDGRGVLVTGAVGGIGAAVARAFAELRRAGRGARPLRAGVREASPPRSRAGSRRDRRRPRATSRRTARSLQADGEPSARSSRSSTSPPCCGVAARHPRGRRGRLGRRRPTSTSRRRSSSTAAFAELLRAAGRAGAIVNFSSQGWWTGGLRRLGRLQRDQGRDRDDDARARADVRRRRDPASTRVAPGLVDTRMLQRRALARACSGARRRRCRSAGWRRPRRSRPRPCSSPPTTPSTSPARR